MNHHFSTAQPHELVPDQLVSRIDIFRTNIQVTIYRDSHAVTTPTTPTEIQRALAPHVRVSTPILPPGALFWHNQKDRSTCAIWQPPSIKTVNIRAEPGKETQQLRLPMPAALFVCQTGRAPHMFACPDRPTQPEDKTYHFPAFNIFRDGRICPGSHLFSDDPAIAARDFWESGFTIEGDHNDRSLRHPASLWQLWQDINDTATFPNEDLVAGPTIEQIMHID